ncbi:MAG: signal peptide peptidase SppA [Chloroflexaceae bacterium]|jgi:protease-4|nr:signal peptide peptidase SppA [Chloroflexaceae bacterium]
MEHEPKETPPAPTAPPAQQSSNRSWLIAGSLIVGIVLACAILPLGGLGLFLFTADRSAGGGPQPAGSWGERVVSGSGPDRVVIIEVNGTIGVGGGDVFGGGLSQDQLLSQIRQATEDPLVKAVVLRVDSPGGGVVASSELHAALKKLREADKHLVVSMGSVAASGGYYIATAAERIYANADTFTGSLGVILSLTNLEGTYEKIGLRTYVYKSGELKDIGSPDRPPTAEENAVLQGVVDQAYQGFVDVIVAGRNLPRDEVLRIADGRIYTGRQALDLKLIDALGGLDEAIAGAKELAELERALVVRYTSRSSLAALLEARLAQPQPQADLLGVRALTDPPAPRLEYRWVP